MNSKQLIEKYGNFTLAQLKMMVHGNNVRMGPQSQFWSQHVQNIQKQLKQQLRNDVHRIKKPQQIKITKSDYNSLLRYHNKK